MFPFIQQVVTTPFKKTVPKGKTGIPAPAKLIKLELELELQPGVLSELPVLQPGAAYKLRVTARHLEHGADCIAIYESETIELLLQIKGEAAPYITISASNVTLSFRELLAGPIEFTIQIAPDCPNLISDFILLYRLFVKTPISSWKQLPPLQAKLAGQHYLPPPDMCEQTQITLDTATPDFTAMLYITAPAADKFHLCCWHRRKLLAVGPLQQPEIGLAGFVEEKVFPDSIHYNVRRFSRNAPSELIQWLKMLVELYQKNLCLVIVDETDAELPWEMVELADDVYLGAVALVVRWTPTKMYTERLYLQIEDTQVVGQTDAFFADDINDTEIEQAKLEQFQTTYHPNIDSLIHALMQPLDTTGLVYIASHGMVVAKHKHEEIVLKMMQDHLLHNPSEQLATVDFESIKAQSGRRPIFFINACHSARLLRDCYSGGLIGLPEVLLARAASAVIGTLGPVGTEHAASIAAYILEVVHTDEQGAHLAEVLRQLRAKAVQQVKELNTGYFSPEEKQKRWCEFIYTFMYVYFGNPLARLKLDKTKK